MIQNTTADTVSSKTWVLRNKHEREPNEMNVLRIIAQQSKTSIKINLVFSRKFTPISYIVTEINAKIREKRNFFKLFEPAIHKKIYVIYNKNFVLLHRQTIKSLCMNYKAAKREIAKAVKDAKEQQLDCLP